MKHTALYPLLLSTCLCVQGTVVFAQDEEESGGMLVDFLEDTLSGDGRQIKVTGLEGALSARATIGQIAVSDDDGIWLTINNAVLDWNRLALVRGRFSVNALTAEEIRIERKPLPSTAPEPLPDAEAQPFQVPELPVAIELGEIRVDTLSLGEDLAGLAADLEVRGALSMADGTLDTNLSVTRLDRPGDGIKLVAGFANETDQITLDLQVAEDAGGLISTLMNLPDTPPLLLTAKGAGPLTDFTADIGLSSHDTQNVTGQVRLRGVPTPDTEDDTSIAFTADIGGDLTPFLAPEFDPFFGTETKLFLDGRNDPTGRLEITDLDITSEALRVGGEFALSEEGEIETVALQGRITPPEGDTILLPMADPRTTLEGAQFSALLDSNSGDSWYISLNANGVQTPDMDLDRARLWAQGVLDQGDALSLNGDMQASLSGLGFSDPALAQAAGEDITLDGFFDLTDDGQLQLTDMTLNGGDFTVNADALVSGLNSGFEVDGAVELDASDLARFSGLAGQDLGGSVTAALDGKGAPLGGSFDFQLMVEGTDLETGTPDVDTLLEGSTTIALDAVRDAQGLLVRSFTLDGKSISADAAAKVTGLGDALALEGSLKLDARELAMFSDLVKQDMGGSLTADLDGSASLSDLHFDLQGTIAGRDLQTGLAQFDPILRGPIDLSVDAKNDTEGAEIRKLTLNGRNLNADITARATGIADGSYTVTDADIAVDARDLSVLSNLLGREVAGRVSVKLDGSGALHDQSFDARVSIEAQDLQSGLPDLDPLLAGPIALSLDARNDAEGAEIRKLTLNGRALTVDASAKATGITDGDYAVSDATISVDASDLSVFSALAKRELGGSISANMAGGGALKDQSFDARLDLDARDLKSGIEQVDALIQGRTTLQLDAAKDATGLDIRDLQLNGTALTAQAQGAVRENGGTLKFSVVLDELNRITELVSGPLSLGGDVGRTADGFQGMVQLDGPDTSYAKLDGAVDFDGGADLDFDAKFNRIERFVPDFPGSISATGNARRDEGQWTINTTANGPADIIAEVAGTFDESSTEADLSAKGQINIGIANHFIAPNALDGTAQFDMALRGTPSLDALSGTISTSGTSMAIPTAGQTLKGITGQVAIADSAAAISIDAGLRAGGGFRVSGPVALTPPFNSTVTVDLNQLILTDNVLYDSSANGQIVLSGALAGNSNLAGRIEIGETNINLNASTGAVGAAPIPDIIHLRESSSVFQTRERAQLVVEEDTGGGGAGTMALNIDIVVPNKVFVRGRGLNAELGGAVNIGGTTASVTPSGQIELIRGNMDLLGRRLVLTKGIVTLQGNLNPYIEFESTTTTSDGQATLEIAGPLDLPEIKVYSDPERPSEEALAMLLFGNRFSELSPLVIAQMAASLAQLSGAGGDATKGIRDSTGVDTLDVSAAEGGGGQFGAGAYLGDNLYTDFTVNTRGETEVNLNLDVTDNITVKGTVDNTGNTGLGVFFERDY